MKKPLPRLKFFGCYWITVCGVAGLLMLPDRSWGGEEPSLEIGVGWALVEIVKEGKVVVPAKGDHVRIRFGPGKKFSGSAGVNSIGGTFAAGEDGSFRIGEIMMTEMAGDPKLMAQETEVAKLLMKATRYRIEEGKLFLSDAAGNNGLRYVPNTPPPALPFKGIVWELTIIEVTAGDAVSAEPPAAGAAPTVSFGESSVTGSGGVREFSAPVGLGKKPGELVLGKAVPKDGGKPGGGRAGEIEGKFFGHLEAMSRYVVDADRMTLSNDAGTVRLIFKAKGS